MAEGFESRGVMCLSETTAEREHLEFEWNLRPYSHRMRAVARNLTGPGLGDHFDLRLGTCTSDANPLHALCRLHRFVLGCIYLHVEACCMSVLSE